jgi:single-stranded-DNA-specific exonuclease
VLPAPDAHVIAALSAALQIGPATAKVLAHRGFSDPAAARRFLRPAFEELHDPMSLRDMPVAIERIARAIRERERILIYGDYDVDGTTSVVLLTKAFEMAGGIATYHVPHRLKDGYGLRKWSAAPTNSASTSSSRTITCRRRTFRRHSRC